MSSLDLISALSNMIGSPVISLKTLSGGGNSKVMLMQCANKQRYVVKRYAASGTDTDQRMTREITAITSLTTREVTCIPPVIAADERLHLAIFAYVSGKKLSPRSTSHIDIQEYVSFLSLLWDIKQQHPMKEIQIAPEACFSLHDMNVSLTQRYTRLLSARHIPRNAETHMKAFLEKEIFPTISEALLHAQQRRKGKPQTLDKQYWTYCPLDFGIHNAIKTADGLIFIDFEHFGLADPVKIISDFLLHPQNTISFSLKKYFAQKSMEIFSSDTDLHARMSTYFPLYTIQWALILLNEFLPEHTSRRSFAKEKTHISEALLEKQIQKSRNMLKHMRDIERYFNNCH